MHNGNGNKVVGIEGSGGDPMKMQLDHQFTSNKIFGPQIILMTIFFIVKNEIRNPQIKT